MRAQRVSDGTRADASLYHALRHVGATSVLANTLDPVTTELVRLRCARYHDCRICQSGRHAAARDAGLNETMADKVDQYWNSDLSERHQVALRYADAMMTQPGEMNDALCERIHHHFSPREIILIGLLVMKFNHQKIHVSLGTDMAPAPGKLVQFDFGDDGEIDPSTLKVLETPEPAPLGSANP